MASHTAKYLCADILHVSFKVFPEWTYCVNEVLEGGGGAALGADLLPWASVSGWMRPFTGSCHMPSSPSICSGSEADPACLPACRSAPAQPGCCHLLPWLYLPSSQQLPRDCSILSRSTSVSGEWGRNYSVCICGFTCRPDLLQTSVNNVVCVCMCVGAHREYYNTSTNTWILWTHVHTFF